LWWTCNATCTLEPLVAVARNERHATRRRQPSAPLRTSISTTHISFKPLPPSHHAHQTHNPRCVPLILHSHPSFISPNNMSFKRKRSDDDSPLSVSSWGSISTLEAQSPIPFPQVFNGGVEMDMGASSRHNGWGFGSASRVKSSDWGNRTHKRFRDNRPDERAIHGRLFPRHLLIESR
jgi:hypothetical protein